MTVNELKIQFGVHLMQVKGELEILNKDSYTEVLEKLFAQDKPVVVMTKRISEHLNLTALSVVFSEISIVHENATQEETLALCSKAIVGITSVDAIIADTGTIVIESQAKGDRLCSLVPEIHVGILLGDKIYANMGDYISSNEMRNSVFFITGPSRTADIEKTLVLGAHGPKRLIVILPD